MASPIDDLYESIFGKVPAKAGVAYEKLSAAVMKLLSDSGSLVQHDARLRGAISNTLYQIDVLKQNDDETKTAGEAKDYTERGGKVGRGDLQKLAGALPDIDVAEGVFISATDFTKPARKYAAAAEELVGKPISLFHIRPVTIEDLDGRLKQIAIILEIITPDYSDAKIVPVYTSEGLTKLKEMRDNGVFTNGQKIQLETIFKADGSPLVTLRELTLGGFGVGEDMMARGCWTLPDGFISAYGELIPLHGMSYEVKMRKDVREIIIEKTGKAVLLAKSDDGETDTLIHEDELRNMKFNAKGLIE